VIQSLVNHYAAVNVEAQLAQPASLLHWVRGILEVRRRHRVFGDGDFVPIEVDNDAVLAFTRSNAEETVLCVMNLANTPRAAVLDLPGQEGMCLTDVFGGARFPRVGRNGRVAITLGSRDFFWLVVSPSDAAEDAPLAGMPAHVPPEDGGEPDPAEAAGTAGSPPEPAVRRPTYAVPPAASSPRAPVLPASAPTPEDDDARDEGA